MGVILVAVLLPDERADKVILAGHHLGRIGERLNRLEFLRILVLYLLAHLCHDGSHLIVGRLLVLEAAEWPRLPIGLSDLIQSFIRALFFVSG